MNFPGKPAYRIVKASCFFLAGILSFTAHSQKIHSVENLLTGKIDNSPRVFTEAEMKAYEEESREYSGLSKVIAVDATPALYYSKTESWPEGAWGRGYATETDAKQFYEAIPGKNPAYFSPHPLIRVNQFFLTAHIYDYLAGINPEKNLEIIKKGVDNMLEEQRPDGMFTFWNKRQTQINMSSSDYKDADGETVELNKGDDFETAHGLNALCEYYNSEIDYRRPEVLEAIRRSEKSLITISDFISNTNNNYRGMALWAISGSYRITENKLALAKIRDIAKQVMDDQSKDGQWRTGGQDEIEYNGKTYMTWHDQKVFYHFLILRGLTEALDVVPNRMLRMKILKSLKSALNHVIDYRMNPKASGFLYAYDILTADKEPQTIYITSLSWYDFYEPSITTEALLRLHKYARESDQFSADEVQSISDLTNIVSHWTGNGKAYFRPAAMYNFYMKK